MNSSKKVYFALIVAFTLLTASIFGMLYFSKNFLSKSEDELIAAKLEIIKQEEIEKTYRDNINNLEKFAQTASILEEVIPKEKDQAVAVREIDAIAKQNGMVINTLSFPSSDLNKKAATPTTGSTATTAKTTAVSQAKPIKGLTGVLGIDINVELRSANEGAISTDQLLGMLRALENNRRNMRVTSINYNAGDQTVDIKLIIFIKP
jgi:hypothetical protein